MATPPDFTAGQVLTAAQMNQVGLWKMVPTGATNGTVATNGDVTANATVSSLTITGCFTSDFDNYLIQAMGGSFSVANNDLTLQLRTSGGTTSTTGYYMALIYSTYASATPVAFNTNNGTYFQNAGGVISTTTPNMSLTMLAPNLARRTVIGGPFTRGDVTGHVSGYHDVATAYNSIVLAPVSGTISSIIVRIYGYN